jgi:hypothetical protein
MSVNLYGMLISFVPVCNFKYQLQNYHVLSFDVCFVLLHPNIDGQHEHLQKYNFYYE